jgi:aminoglycoside phosphotransferase (APT) family kinase protein
MTAVPAEALDLASLRYWLAGHVEGIDRTPLRAELVVGGRSNLTFFISQRDQRWVLRRPPLGHVLPSAHDMRREYTVLRALQDTDVPVPRVHALCEDVHVVGSPFYVMELVAGTALRDAADSAPLTVGQRRELSVQLIDVLARIHRVDWRAVGLNEFGRPEGFIERQVGRWTQQWEKSRTRDLPAVDELAARLAASVPPSPPGTLVHGDFRLDNVLFALGQRARPTAVLDWEMSTLGDPLADLGLLLVYWPDPSDPRALPSVAPQLSGQAGFLTRAEMGQEYGRLTGLDLTHLPYYVALGYFKLAIILEGIHHRYLMGRTVGEGFELLGAEVPHLVDRAFAVVESGLSEGPAALGGS